MNIRPITIREAAEFVREVHRHNRPPVGAMFSVACEEDGKLIGVAMVGRPVARALQDGRTAEVIRVATDGTDNACSMLYGAALRACKAMGYTRVYTYTLEEEPGASLRASGFVVDAHLKARPTWDTPSRRREQEDEDGVKRPPGAKIRWIWRAVKGNHHGKD